MVATSKNEPNAAVSSKVEALYDSYPFPPGTSGMFGILSSGCLFVARLWRLKATGFQVPRVQCHCWQYLLTRKLPCVLE